MKKIFWLLVLCFLSQPVLAKTITVEALSDFSSEYPSKTLSVKVLEDLYISDSDILFKCGDIVEGEVRDVFNPKRLKRDAGFSFLPQRVKNNGGEFQDVKGYYPAKYTTKLNKGQVAKSAALGVGNYFVKGLSVGYSAVEGAVKNEKNNRFKSSVNAVYESSPFSYIEKGEQIEIKSGDNFYLNFKINDENAPNYEYTSP